MIYNRNIFKIFIYTYEIFYDQIRNFFNFYQWIIGIIIIANKI